MNSDFPLQPETPDNPTEKAARVARRAGGKLARGKTKDGRQKWQLRIFRGNDAAGKRMYYTETFIGGSRQADARLAELYNRRKSGLPLRYDPMAFKDFFAEWLKDRDDGNIRESTVA
jgi:hypothetical protein